MFRSIFYKKRGKEHIQKVPASVIVRAVRGLLLFTYFFYASNIAIVAIFSLFSKLQQ